MEKKVQARLHKKHLERRQVLRLSLMRDHIITHAVQPALRMPARSLATTSTQTNRMHL
jgi:hypothetical protein